MKSKLLTLAGALALTTLLGHYYAKPLLAQVRAALVSNIDDPGRIAYQALINGSTLGNCQSSGCDFKFAPVPAGHRLVVEHVSMFIQAKSGSIPARVSVGFGVGGGSVFFATVQNQFFAIQFDQPVLVYFDAGETPETAINDVNINTADPTVVQAAVLSGYLLDCGVAPCSPIVRH